MEKQKKQISTTAGCLIILVLLVIGFIIFSNGAENNSQPDPTPSVIDKISENLKGVYSKEEISKKFEQAFSLYNLEKTEKNYNLIGNLLIDARIDYQKDEFSLLNCSISKYKPGENISKKILDCALASTK